MRRATILLSLTIGVARAQTPIEYGTIAWRGSHAEARAAAIAARLPLLVVFQEVPG